MHKKESGYIALGAILFGTLAGLVMLSNQNGRTNQAVKSAEVRKQSIDAEEMSLYGFSILKQLLRDSSKTSPLHLKNAFNPASIQDIVLETTNLPSNGSIALISSRDLTIMAPDAVGTSAEALNEVFGRGSFAAVESKKIPIRLRVVDFETYATGYGVRTLIVASRITLPQDKEKKTYEHHARLPVPLGAVDCTITIQGSDAASENMVVTQSSSGARVPVNARCQGDVIQAELAVNSIRVKDAVLPATLDPLFTDYAVTNTGVYEVRLAVTRVDETVFEFGPVTLTLAGPATASRDFEKCLYRCTCVYPSSEPPTLCAGYTDFYNPFSPHVTTGDPLPALPGNPLTDANAVKILDDWAFAHGAVHIHDAYGVRIQGILFPDNGYGKKLVCSKIGGGGSWDSYAFDPDNGCQEEFIGKRGELGCLVEGTQILVGPEKMKPIEQLTKSDRIWNPMLSRYYEIERIIRGPEKRELYKIVAGGRAATMTFDHPVLSQRGYIQASELTREDSIWLSSGYVQVMQIERIPNQEHAQVWNLIIKGASKWNEHLVFADGIAVGDLWMQTELAKKRKHEK